MVSVQQPQKGVCGDVNVGRQDEMFMVNYSYHSYLNLCMNQHLRKASKHLSLQSPKRYRISLADEERERGKRRKKKSPTL